ncbi:hypothetical protein CYMTET_46203 [Cymbomonas tetramitiformis]|uniref:GOLD domain-containing protein n=1 Tax=Cymbomonas tetramitiformis TaxID=36881 RepID=A0AAE0BY50_9CHLO|nr:hypothetical protein CYMTET_46203 [Cymbomonas tetramitiformis]
MNSHNRRMRTVVDVKVKSPYGEMILDEKDVNEESFELTGKGAGKYSMCFSTRGEVTKQNQPISLSETQYVARVDIYYFVPIHMWDNPEEIQIPHGHEDRRSKLILNQEAVSDAGRLVSDMKRRTSLMLKEQDYLMKRELRHRKTVDSTNARSLHWAMTEFLVFLGLAILQVVLLRQYFEVKSRPGKPRSVPTL